MNSAHTRNQVKFSVKHWSRAERAIGEALACFYRFFRAAGEISVPENTSNKVVVLHAILGQESQNHDCCPTTQRCHHHDIIVVHVV